MGTTAAAQLGHEPMIVAGDPILWLPSPQATRPADLRRREREVPAVGVSLRF